MTPPWFHRDTWKNIRVVNGKHGEQSYVRLSIMHVGLHLLILLLL
jgi:hypothetical protein